MDYLTPLTVLLLAVAGAVWLVARDRRHRNIDQAAYQRFTTAMRDLQDR